MLPRSSTFFFEFDKTAAGCQLVYPARPDHSSFPVFIQYFST